MPDHGGELGGDLVSAKHSVCAGREEQRPQPAPTGLRPIHFIHFIEAAMTNRVPNPLGGVRNPLQHCNVWQAEFFDRESDIRFARSELVSQEDCDSSMTIT